MSQQNTSFHGTCRRVHSMDDMNLTILKHEAAVEVFQQAERQGGSRWTGTKRRGWTGSFFGSSRCQRVDPKGRTTSFWTELGESKGPLLHKNGDGWWRLMVACLEAVFPGMEISDCFVGFSQIAVASCYGQVASNKCIQMLDWCSLTEFKTRWNKTLCHTISTLYVSLFVLNSNIKTFNTRPLGLEPLVSVRMKMCQCSHINIHV